MITPKLKALSLIESMSFSKSKQMNYANGEMVDIPQNLYAKQCALIAVDEIYNTLKDTLAPAHGVRSGEDYKFHNQYWEEVKQEINKL
jgi:hypothetical protein